TLVEIPSLGRAFIVTLHSSGDPLGDEFLKRGEFPVLEIYGRKEQSALEEKLEKYGVRRSIDMNSLPGPDSAHHPR
ncbi:MAG TPA: hypothetical protein VMD56_11980, partial [Steroidobacteraceae bacterium]|nr:hypothetical protein [Steroidobacteraceae bacterium]